MRTSRLLDLIIKPGLPYINNWPVLIFTVAVNVLCLFLFQWGRAVTLQTVILDAVNMGVITSFINVFVADYIIKKQRREGRLPSSIPVVRRMSLLPKNPLALSLVFGAAFGLLSPAFTLFVIWFYGIDAFSFTRFGVWKAAFACALSAFIFEWAVLRYVQPDCAEPADKPQSGVEEVKNPLRRISALKEVYDSAIADFGFNLLFGLLLGGTVIRENEVIIPPVTRDGIVIAGIIIGVIVTFRMAYPIAKNMLGMRERGELPISPESDRRVAWLPYPPKKFALALTPFIIAVCTLSFWAIMTFFGFEEMNFFQFFVVRLLLISLLSRCVVKLAVWRYIEP